MFMRIVIIIGTVITVVIIVNIIDYYCLCLQASAYGLVAALRSEVLGASEFRREF